jgi:uncharacterized Zn-finger protein
MPGKLMVCSACEKMFRSESQAGPEGKAHCPHCQSEYVYSVYLYYRPSSTR